MAKKKAAKVYDKKTNNVLVNVVLDRSGSMESGRAGTITGYNAYIDELKIDKAINYSVTMIQFDTNGGKPELTVKYRDLPIKDVPALTDAEYEPRGGTPLYDAIGECIRRVEAKGRSVLVVIITDGWENSSTEFTRDSIKKLIAGKEAEGWTFAFLGANIDSYAVGGSIGTQSANTSNYQVGNEQQLYAALAQSTMARSHVAANQGVRAASMTAMFTDHQRASMGGPSPVRQSFHATKPSRRKWAVGD